MRTEITFKCKGEKIKKIRKDYRRQDAFTLLIFNAIIFLNYSWLFTHFNYFPYAPLKHNLKKIWGSYFSEQIVSCGLFKSLSYPSSISREYHLSISRCIYSRNFCKYIAEDWISFLNKTVRFCLYSLLHG